MSTTPIAAALTRLRQEAAPRNAAEHGDAQLLDDYTNASDQSAFTALVRRHGPMVLGVCRRVLHDAHDAEDAFQAVFLVLARGARSIRKGEALSSWLHGVSYRVAMRAKRDAARRRKHEGRAPPRANPPAWEIAWRELQAVLDEEVEHLSPAYRAAFVLCCLDGLSSQAAAQRLGVNENTVFSRLARARKQLRERLAGRGISLSAVLAALAVSGAGRAAVPPALARTATQASRLGAVDAVTGLSAKALLLAEGVTRTMMPNNYKLATALILTLCALGTGLGVLARPAPVDKEAPPAQATGPKAVVAPQPAKEQTEGTAEYRGRVLGPDDRPVAGAKLHMTLAWVYRHPSSPSPAYATTGPDGRFAFTVPKARFGNQATVVAATAANHGAGWVEVPAEGKRDALTIRLVKDDVPITGQIVDLEGKPVSGATVTVLRINAAPKEDLGPWLDAVKARKGVSFQLEYEYLKRHTVALPLKVTTNAEGRFKLTGIGRNRIVAVQLDGPTIASQQFHMLTRPGATLEVLEFRDRTEYGVRGKVATYYGCYFRHVAAPNRPVVGVVRDRDTRKPLAGITVGSYTRAIAPGLREGFDLVRTTTDAEGRYRLVGMPKGEGYTIVAISDGDRPYVATHKDVPDGPGLAPVTVDIELKRGVWIEGKITDKVTGKPLKASVEYFALYNNRHLRDYPGFDGTFFHDRVNGTKEDGSYRVVGLPGPGLIAAVYIDPYLRAPDRDDEYGNEEKFLSTAPYHLGHPINYGALARVNPAKGAEAVKRDVTFDPGWTFKGRVLGPDGKPLAGARDFGLTGYRWWEHERLKTAEFTVQGFNPRRPRELLFQHPEKGLVGVAQPPKKNGDTVMVRLGPGAAVTGRLVDDDGKPRAGVALQVWFRLKEDRQFRQYPSWSPTDREGRFRIQALLPGYEFRLSDGKAESPIGVAPRSGQTKDLGDVKVK